MEHFVSIVYVAVIDLLICDKVGEDAGFQAGHAGDHHQKSCVLNLIDPAGAGCGQHVPAALDHTHIEVLPADIPHSEEGAGRQTGGLMQIGLLPERDYLAAAIGILFDVFDQIVDQIIALNSCSIPLSDRSVSDIPRIPPGHSVFFHLRQHVGRVLINGEDLADSRLPCLRTKCADREFAPGQVVFAKDMIYADRVCRRPVFINRPGILILVAVFQYISDIPHEIPVSFCHHNYPLSNHAACQRLHLF